MSKCIFARLCPCLGGGDAPKAVVKNGMLVLSLTNAISPVIWRLSLSQVAASAIEVQAEAAQDNLGQTSAAETHDASDVSHADAAQIYSLVLKNQKAIVSVIARFSSRDAAVKALRVMMRAMENAREDDFVPQTIAGASSPQMAGQDRAGIAAVNAGPTGAGMVGYDKSKGLKNRPILSGFIGAAIVILLLALLVIFTPRPQSALSGASLSQTGQYGAAQTGGSVGSAVSADDFLRQKGL